MITSKHLDKFTAALLAIAVLLFSLTLVSPPKAEAANGNSLPAYARVLGQGSILELDIRMAEADWQSLLDNALAEEYTLCNVVINNLSLGNVGIRAKGNTSLSQVAASGSQRYSFKLEFDHYVSGQTWLGLDKLALNNNISDATSMKEYLTYQWMAELGVDTPLCSYVKVSVNGQYWGLYLGVEAMEESYASRCFGPDYGQLYKPETMEMGGMGGGGRQPGQEQGRDFPSDRDVDFSRQDFPSDGQNSGEQPPDMGMPPEGFTPPEDEIQQNAPPDGQEPGNPPSDGEIRQLPGGVPPENVGENQSSDMGTPPESFTPPEGGGFPFDGENGFPEGGFGKGGFGGMSGGGADLVYTDDNPESYSALFDSAVFDSDEGDQSRLIAALKQLSQGENLESCVDVEKVLAYFAVSAFTVNLDGYLSNMTHNYYLYEKDGLLTMLPWDFNLSFAGFQSGDASSAVNFPIDTPVSGVTLEQRPLLGKLLENDEYLALYHEYLSRLAEQANNGTFRVQIAKLESQLSDLVAGDPTAFYTAEEFSEAVDMLQTFVSLRGESVKGQLDGSIPSTEEGQRENPSALIDASAVTLSVMGSQGGMGGMGGFGQAPDGAPGGKWSEENRGSPDIPDTPGNSAPLIWGAGILVMAGALLAAVFLFRPKWPRLLKSKT